MADEIPLTELDKRYYPEITKKQINKFVLVTLKLDALVFDEQQIIAGEMIPQTCDPHIAGTFRAFNYIKSIATDPQLFNIKQTITATNINTTIMFCKRIHKNLLFDSFLANQRVNDHHKYPQFNDLGFFRAEKLNINDSKKPLEQIATAFDTYINIYKQYHNSISNPKFMEKQHWKRIEAAARQLAIDVAAIDPFPKGSSQVARLLENLCRMNVGLRFKTYEDDSSFNSDVASRKRSL